jgi:hypothetical protein
VITTTDATGVTDVIEVTVATAVIAVIGVPGWTARTQGRQTAPLNQVHQPPPPNRPTPASPPTPAPHRQTTGFAPISRTAANNANGAGDQIVGIADLDPIAIPDDLHNETRPIMTPLPASSPLKTLATALTKNCQRTLR